MSPTGLGLSDEVLGELSLGLSVLDLSAWCGVGVAES